MRRTPPSLRPVTLAGLEIADRSGDLTDAIEVAMAQAEWLTQQGPAARAVRAPWRRPSGSPSRGPRHVRYVHARGRRWEWEVVDEATTPNTVLAKGRAWSRERAWKRAHRAYMRVLADDRDYHNENCRNALPLALVLMPYALLRYAIDGLRKKVRR